jgi:DNA-directed RNA polymerase subunit RPC12/RpoP
MSFELLFAIKENSDIQMLMNVFRASFHEPAGRTVTKYVFDSGKSYLLTAQKTGIMRRVMVGASDYDTVCVLLQQIGTTWKVRIAAASMWDERALFSSDEVSLLEEVKRFFAEKCESLIRVVRTWTTSQGEVQGVESEEPEVMPLESELTDEGTLVRCPRCGSTEIIFPNLHTCTQCGADILNEGRLSRRGEPEEKVSMKRDNLQARGEVGRCMVCGLGIYQGEPLLTCPNCSGKAHRTHLLEYTHVKGQCPSCRAHLSEEELAENLLVGQRTKNPQKPRKKAKSGPSSINATN